ncbi:MAG: hypothetical protein ACFFER_20245 [Candidatus Thorarchaeota archaeon]
MNSWDCVQSVAVTLTETMLLFMLLQNEPAVWLLVALILGWLGIGGTAAFIIEGGFD